MNSRLLQWLKDNERKTFESPRKEIFGGNPQCFTLRYIDEEKQLIRISFSKKRTLALPLYFWMFDRTLEYLEKNPFTTFPIGARLQPPYPRESIEDAIWQSPKIYPSEYKSSPHVLDLLALAGFVQFDHTTDRDTGRKVQGARVGKMMPVTVKSKDTMQIPVSSVKEQYIKQYGETIRKWTEEHQYEIIKNRLNYHWRKETRKQCEEKRNEVAKQITQSRIRNNGALDLETLDTIIRWGFGAKYPDRDPEKALEVTKKAFTYLDKGNIPEATLTLLHVKGLGISRVTKILGLSDQENLCIYDSRVGYALRTLTINEKRLHLIPISRTGRLYDNGITPKVWAREYQKILWTIELIKGYMNQQGCTYRQADVEMALFMMGK